MSADPLVAKTWNNRSTIDAPIKHMGANLTGVKMGVPSTGVPINDGNAFKDVQPSLPTGDTNPMMRRRSNVWSMLAVALGLLFLLHLSRG
jgi:hypothetical protein